jgi:hypothetical protein
VNGFLQGATSFGDLPLSDREHSWSRDDAFDRVRKWASSDGSGDKSTIDWEKFRSAFFWYDASAHDAFGSYKLMFADVVDGHLTAIWGGVTAAAGVLQGARGGVQIPDTDRPAVKTHVAHYYDKASRQYGDKSIAPPWEQRQSAPSVKIRSASLAQAALERDANGRPQVSGALVTYGQRNANGYLHVPGSARASLARRQQAGRPISMGYQHHELAPLQVIGAWSEWNDSSAGVQAGGAISDTTLGRDVATLVEDQAITGISIGFRCADESEDGSDPVQLLAPGQTGSWQTPYGSFTYTADEWTICFSAIEIDEASLVHAPADDAARIQMLQTLAQASRAMPGLADDGSGWEDVAYSMALLMGGRGAAAFADLGDVEHFALYQRLTGRYQLLGRTPPGYVRQPEYRLVQFQHDERTVFADRFLRKTAATLTATANGIQGPLSPETREVVNQARAALDAVVQTSGLAAELHDFARRLEASAHSLQETKK